MAKNPTFLLADKSVRGSLWGAGPAAERRQEGPGCPGAGRSVLMPWSGCQGGSSPRGATGRRGSSQGVSQGPPASRRGPGLPRAAAGTSWDAQSNPHRRTSCVPAAGVPCRPRGLPFPPSGHHLGARLPSDLLAVPGPAASAPHRCPRSHQEAGFLLRLFVRESHRDGGPARPGHTGRV